MTLSFVDPGMVQTVVNWWLQGTEGSGWTPADPSTWTDYVDASPTFDTDHVIYTSTPQNSAIQTAVGDNSDGLEDPMHLVPSLSYAYTTGYSNTHTESKALTIGITQAFNYSFSKSVGGATTLSASGTFSTSDAGTTNNSKTLTDSVQAPFDIPKGKIYEEKLLFSQEQAQVPYVSTIHVKGWAEAQQYNTLGAVFTLVHRGVTTGNFPPPYKDVNWADVNGSGNNIDGTYNLPGTLTMYGASTFRTKVFDITNQTNQNAGPGTLVTESVPQAFSGAPQGAAPAQGLAPAAPGGAALGTAATQDPPAPAVGVDHVMDDAGRTFYDTPNDDLVTGGAGDDHIFLSGGQDIAQAGDGNDTIVANGDGNSLLDGGAGDDTILLDSTQPLNALEGGEGNDFLQAFAPYSMVYGGPGDDTFLLREDVSGGSVVTDSDGANKLFINTAAGGQAQLGFQRIQGSDTLYILLNGDQNYSQGRDVAWADFFADPDNQVNGLSADQVAALAQAPPPPTAADTTGTTGATDTTGTTGASGATDTSGATGTTGSTDTSGATGIVAPTGINQTVSDDAEQIASGANLSTGQEQALLVGANDVSRVLAAFQSVLAFVPPDVLQTAIADLLHATSPLSVGQSQELAGDIIANPYGGDLSSMAQSIPTPPLGGADSTNPNTVGNMIFALAHTWASA